MTESVRPLGPPDLAWIARATSVVVVILALAALVYALLDIVLLLFVGIVVAAALQPWHVRLTGWGVPKGIAVLLIYAILLAGLIVAGLVAVPPLIDGISHFTATIPQTYANLRTSLASAPAPVRMLAQHLPAFDRLTQTVTTIAPQFVESAVGATTRIVTIFAYLGTILAVAFYWTMELPRFERLILSLVPVASRAHALNVWHEIEAKLGAFMRAQGFAMLTIGAASGIGYAIIGLPNVMALAVLAGLFEAVPMIGPLLGAVPAVLMAIPLGLHTVVLVVGLSVLLQAVENNLLIPRIMERAVGVSALVSIVAILAFGALYGILGVLIAVPVAAVVQVVLETLVGSSTPVEIPGVTTDPWAELLVRMRMLRDEARARFRARETRMGIDPDTLDHTIDVVDQEIEELVDRVETLIAAVQDPATSLDAGALESVTQEIAQHAARVDALATRGEPIAKSPIAAPAPLAISEPSRGS